MRARPCACTCMGHAFTRTSRCARRACCCVFGIRSIRQMRTRSLHQVTITIAGLAARHAHVCVRACARACMPRRIALRGVVCRRVVWRARVRGVRGCVRGCVHGCVACVACVVCMVCVACGAARVLRVRLCVLTCHHGCMRAVRLPSLNVYACLDRGRFALARKTSSRHEQAAKQHGAVVTARALTPVGGATGFRPAMTRRTRKHALQMYACHVTRMTTHCHMHGLSVLLLACRRARGRRARDSQVRSSRATASQVRSRLDAQSP